MKFEKESGDLYSLYMYRSCGLGHLFRDLHKLINLEALEDVIFIPGHNRGACIKRCSPSGQSCAYAMGFLHQQYHLPDHRK